MSIEILCRPTFSADEIAALDRIAKRNGVTRAEIVRRAVSIFSSECVPTHSRKSGGKARL